MPYYNLLDNTFYTTLDLGVAFKVVQADFKAEGVSYDGFTDTDYTDSVNLLIPLAYARLRFEIPVINIGLESDAKYVTYKESTVYDLRVKIDYTLESLPVIQPAFEVGYRVQNYKIVSDDDKSKLDMEFSGFYAGVMLRF